MARVKGQDVVVDLMDAVAKLEATAAEHADLLESIAGHAMSTSAELTALSGRVNFVSGRVSDLSARMQELSGQMEDVAQRVSALEGDFQSLAQNFVRSAVLSRTMQTQLGQFARVLGEFAGGSKKRFQDIEDRLETLEKKAG